jgi:hypothetical protein
MRPRSTRAQLRRNRAGGQVSVTLELTFNNHGAPARGQRLKLNPTQFDQLFGEIGEPYVFAACSLEAVPLCFLAGIVAVVDVVVGGVKSSSNFSKFDLLSLCVNFSEGWIKVA